MTENFAERFIDHRRVGFAPQTVTKLAFHHGEGGLDIGTLMVMLQEFLLAEIINSGINSGELIRELIRGQTGHSPILVST